MKKSFRYVVNAVGSGFLILIPIYLAVLLMLKAMKSVGGMMRPLAHLVPDWFPAERVLSIAVVLVICFVVGVAVRTHVGRMARDLAIPTEVVACPTVREPDGLALSSRNVHLSPEERAAAPVLRRALLAARARWEAGERSGDALRASMSEALRAERLATTAYVSAADGETLAELDRLRDGAPALLSLAVRFGATRLIDNEPLP